jgi:Insulinase (Peptidase family M16)
MNVRRYPVEKFQFQLSRMTVLGLIGCAGLAAAASRPAPATAPAPASTATPAASAGVAAGFSLVKSLSGIDEYRLDSNGLTVLLVPDHSAPVVTFQVTYQVGSRNEVTGVTGATHILEHMMFKGSEGFNDPKGNSVKQFLERVGGQFNASTSSTAPITSRPSAARVWKAMSRSKPIACAIYGCAKPTGSRR